VMLWAPYAEQWHIIASPSAYPALVCLMQLSPLVGWLAAWEVAHPRRSTSAAHAGIRKRGVVLRTFATAARAAFYLRLLFLRGEYTGTVLVVYAAGVMVASALLYRALAEVLARVPAPRLARWLRWASWGVPAVLLLHLLVYDRSLGTYLASHRYWWHTPAIGWGPVSNSAALWWDLTRLAPTQPRWWSAAAVMLRTIALPPLLIASAITLWRARRRAAHAGRSAASSRP
jgi:hypothetical protein